MSQRIVTTQSVEIPEDADVCEEGRAIAKAFEAAWREAAELGGHSQRIVSMAYEPPEPIVTYSGGGGIAAPGVVTVTTELT